MINLNGRSFLTLLNYSSEEVRFLLALARGLKAKKKAGIYDPLLLGKNIVLIFEKTSTRTRCSFEVACMDEGGGATFLTNSQMGKKESIEDTAKVLGRLYDGIEFRGYQQSTVETLAKYAGVPVWNGLTDQFHPTQVLADYLTIQESIEKPLTEVKLAFVGDGRNNMGNSLMIASAKLGADFTCVAPKSLWPDPDLTASMQKLGQETDSHIEFSDDLAAVAGADAVYTDIWASMGEEAMFEERMNLLSPYRVTDEVMNMTGNPGAIFLHCLPSFHDLNTDFAKAMHEKYGLTEMECSDSVFRGHRSRVFDEAENRLHTIKAVIVATLADPLKVHALTQR